MSKEIVLVTGAAGGTQGQTGRLVSDMLLARGTAVRAFVRKIDERSESLRALGAEVAVGDFHDYRSVERAVQGVSSVYFAYPVQDGLLDATAVMADAARRAGVTRLVDMVMLIPSPGAPTPRMRENYLSEQIFEMAAIGAAHVRATVFYENVRALTAASIAKDSTMYLPWGSLDNTIALVSGEDAARVAAGSLTSPLVTPDSSYPVIGDVLTLREIVATFERVLGRSVRYQEIPDQVWADAALSRGFNAHAVEHLSKLWQSIRNSTTKFEVTDSIQALGGQSRKTFEAFVREQQSMFKPAPTTAQA